MQTETFYYDDDIVRKFAGVTILWVLSRCWWA